MKKILFLIVTLASTSIFAKSQKTRVPASEGQDFIVQVSNVSLMPSKNIATISGVLKSDVENRAGIKNGDEVVLFVTKECVLLSASVVGQPARPFIVSGKIKSTNEQKPVSVSIDPNTLTCGLAQ